ncbi:MAG: rhomboid family intramembrane serine protease [Bowdeniella nasicola]|nr:rhomboid family intramembrane serine protease [Bowdeniella nasicola]
MSEQHSAGEDGRPRCPRHPDVVTYISCQRCGRPTCPACQVQAAVGVHCIDCARAARSRRRLPRTRAGAPLTSSLGTLAVTKTIVGICVVMQLALMIVPAVSAQLMFVPALGVIQPWRFLSAAFVHGSLLHLGLNMLALWIVGQGLEPVLGRWRFTALFLLSALGGSVMVLWLASPTSVSWITGTVGASGALFGMFGAVFVLNKKANADMRAITILIVVNLAYGFLVANVAWQAHLGGLIVGALAVWGFIVSAQRRWKAGAASWTALLTVLLIAAAIAKYVLI